VGLQPEADHEPVDQTGGELLAEDERPRRPADHEVPDGVLGVPDGVHDDVGLVDGGGATGLTPILVRAWSDNGVLIVAGMMLVTLIGSFSRRTPIRSVSTNPSMPCLEAQ
jgi:hypothetical protein